MGTIIKAKRDGYRRAGLVHRAAGTYHQEGGLSEHQLEMLRGDPHLLVVEGTQEDALDDSTRVAELLGEMGGTIAELEHSLEQAQAGLKTASSDVVRLLERQKAAPALILDAVRALEPADPASEGVILITQDGLAAILSNYLDPEAHDDGRTTLDSSGGTEAPPPSPSVSPVPPATGPDAGAVKRGGRRDAEKKGASE